MSHSSWKRHVAFAALVAAPILAGAGPALAQPTAPPTAAETQKATAFFVKGNELFKAKKYALALEQFKRSYALLPSPNSHLYLARCIKLTGDPRAAYLEYDKLYEEAAARAVTEAKYAPTRDSARLERDDLATRLALVTVNVQNGGPSTRLRVSTYDLPPERWGKPYPVEPGMIDVQVMEPGQNTTIHQSLSVGVGQQTSVTINAAGSRGLAHGGEGGAGGAAKKPVNGLRIGAFVASGVGLIGFGGFIGAGLVSKGTYADLNTLCGGKAGCPSPTTSRADVDAKISSGKTQQLLANIGLGVGIAGIATGVTLFVLSTRTKKTDDARPSADLVIGPTWAGVRGVF